MRKALTFLTAAFALLWAAALPVSAQQRPYIGYVYPAGGQQGTTFSAKLGGQNLDGITKVLVTGKGVSAKIIDYYRKIGPQQMTLLSEQLKELKKDAAPAAAMMMMSDTMMSTSAAPQQKNSAAKKNDPTSQLIAKVEKRMAEYCNRPASAALASLVFLEITIDPDAEPGERELRLQTYDKVSTPIVFHVGQLPEYSRKPMLTSPQQVLGKEQLALRNRPADEVEQEIKLPCIVNGQIAPGEVNQYRFSAHKGQRLVISTQARQLIPFIADAVPGWFQPVLALSDADGKEVAYNDDFRFKPDPTILCEIPHHGEYTLSIFDSIYRGREDFVYRITIGELPFVTSLFPIGAQAGAPVKVKTKGWNLGTAELTLPGQESGPGIYPVAARKKGLLSNPVPFALDSLPDYLEKEPNNSIGKAQRVKLPIIINGRMDHSRDCDIFKFFAQADVTIVAEVQARRLDSPLDSIVKITDAAGNLLAFNDDFENITSGVNTHHADSYVKVRVPAKGEYYVHVSDTGRNGGEEFAYRLRLSAAQPDFALRVVPSSINLRSKSAAAASVYIIRKDGFTGPVKLALKDPPAGFTSGPISITGTQEVARLTIKTSLVSTPEPIDLTIVGTAKIGGRDVVRQAVPAEDRMQAFLWRHLVPASELKAFVFDPSSTPAPARVPPPHVPAPTNSLAAADPAAKPKFSKQQIAGRLRDLRLLYEEGLLSDDFYEKKVAECDAAQ